MSQKFTERKNDAHAAADRIQGRMSQRIVADFTVEGERIRHREVTKPKWQRVTTIEIELDGRWTGEGFVRKEQVENLLDEMVEKGAEILHWNDCGDPCDLADYRPLARAFLVAALGLEEE